MSERKREKQEWPSKLSIGLRSWIPEHGYKAAMQLAGELSIPRTNWSHIYQGDTIVAGGGHDNKFDGRLYYARLYLWTELTEADPRNIPDRLIRKPNGGVMTKNRNFSEEEYQKWLKTPEAQELLSKRDARFKREGVMESVTVPEQIEYYQPKESRESEILQAKIETSQPKTKIPKKSKSSKTELQPSQKTESPETARLTVGSLVDDLINHGAAQIASRLLEAQKETIIPQLSELAQRITTLESALDRLITQPQTDRASSSRISRSSGDISIAAKHIKDLLEPYKQGTGEDREKLWKNYGQDLIDLEVILYPLTRPQQEREELIKLKENMNL